MRIDWKAKLTSRKFWAYIAALAISIYILVTSGCTEETIAGVCMALGSTVAYIVGEGLVDASRGQKDIDKADNDVV